MSCAAVIGGGGFVGKYLVRLLMSPSTNAGAFSKVLVLDVRFSDSTLALLSRLSSDNPNVALSHRVVDIRSLPSLTVALSGVRTVFLLAAVIDWKLQPSPALFAVNVVGTSNVITAARQCGVHLLVHASTMDVVLDGSDIHSCDELRPYPPEGVFLSEYCRTKTLSEQLVRGANGPELKTVSLRFGHVYGPEDLVYMPKILGVLKRGAMPLRLGPSHAKTEMVFSGNAAFSMLCADRFVTKEQEGKTSEDKIGGKAYFVGEGYAANMLDLAKPYADKLGISFPRYTLPRFVLSVVIWVLFWLHKALGLLGINFDPDLNAFSVWFFLHNMTFSWEKAKREFGYEPLFSKEKAFEETLEWVKTLNIS